MDQIRLQQQKAMAEQRDKNDYQTLKKVTKLLLSLSVFSFFFAGGLPSWLPLRLFHSSNLHFSTLPLHLFNHTIDKNCMFLLCNGLLVFLANYSGLFRSLSSTSRRNYDSSFRVYEFGPLTDPITLEPETNPSVERDAVDAAATTRDQREAEIEERIVVPAAEGGDGENGGYGSTAIGFSLTEVDDMAADDDEEEESDGVLSDEELNRKFDEFIKRMKEEITIDARRTLVVV